MAAAVDLSFLNGGADHGLPEGTPADPTYLAFLRGMGYDREQAWATAVQHVAEVKSAYRTAVSREPAQLQHALGAVDQQFGADNNYFSGARLANEADAQVQHEQRLGDLATTQAQALSGIHGDLQGQLSALARNNVDQIGALQGRRDEQVNQDRYIKAVAAANAPVIGTSLDPLAAAIARLTGQQPAPTIGAQPAPAAPVAPAPVGAAPMLPKPKPALPNPALNQPFKTYGR